MAAGVHTSNGATLSARLSSVAEAAQAFSAAVGDAPRLLATIAERSSEALSDICIVLQRTPDGEAIQIAALHGRTAALGETARQALGNEPLALATNPFVRHILASGETFLLPHVTPAATHAAASSAYGKFVAAARVHSMLVVPLDVAGRRTGLLSFLRAEADSPSFEEDDRALAQLLASEAALALALTHTPEGFTVDLAARKMEERRRAEDLHARLAAIVEASHDAIIGKTLDGVVTSWNSGAERIFGYPAAEMVGRPIAFLVPADRLHEEEELLAHLRRGLVRELETVRIRKDGEPIDVWVTSSPIRDSRGTIVGAAKVARDITRRKQVERSLLEQKERAEAANRELETFSYSVAHDLRAPLRAMNGFAQLLAETYGTALDEEGRDWLEEIVQGSTRMAALIDALLSMARLARTELRREWIDVTAIVRGVAQEAARSEPGRPVEVEVAEGLRAHADPALTRALFVNLIDNARKFTKHVTHARVEVGATSRDGTAGFYVRDNGAGFDMAYAKKLFVPFQRLHRAVEFPGTGIGLASVQRIVHRHGGHIWAEGSVGHGATFAFTLPGDEP